jgi:predicted GNAT family acetyltransferase
MTEGSVRVIDVLDGVDWSALRDDLVADDFHNGRSVAALRRSFEASSHVAIAWADHRVIGTARLLSDGVCNAYVVDVWTDSAYRRQGVAARMMRLLVDAVPGQHVGLFTDDAQDFYRAIGFRPQGDFLSIVSGRWLDNAANLDAPR